MRFDDSKLPCHTLGRNGPREQSRGPFYVHGSTLSRSRTHGMLAWTSSYADSFGAPSTRGHAARPGRRVRAWVARERGE